VSTFIRWGKFNLVEAMGMGVQLAALAVLKSVGSGHYFYASVAVELTLLHNFLWHLKFTLRDRRDDSAPLAQFVRFHLSNELFP
jgi:putative flippase GtrA